MGSMAAPEKWHHGSCCTGLQQAIPPATAAPLISQTNTWSNPGENVRIYSIASGCCGASIYIYNGLLYMSPYFHMIICFLDHHGKTWINRMFIIVLDHYSHGKIHEIPCLSISGSIHPKLNMLPSSNLT